MPHTLKREKDRMTVCRVLVGVAVAVFKGRPYLTPHKISAGHMDLVLIDAVVMLSTVEKRPKTASGIARTLMMSRPTVLRKLETLIKIGVVRRAGSYYCNVDRPELDYSYLDDALTIIRREGRK